MILPANFWDVHSPGSGKIIYYTGEYNKLNN